MQPENEETNPVVEFSPDLFDEPRDHANQWDVSGIWSVSEPATGELPRPASE